MKTTVHVVAGVYLGMVFVGAAVAVVVAVGITPVVVVVPGLMEPSTSYQIQPKKIVMAVVDIVDGHSRGVEVDEVAELDLALERVSMERYILIHLCLNGNYHFYFLGGGANNERR